MTSFRSVPDALNPERPSHGPQQPETVQLAGRPIPLVGTGRIYVCGITPYDVTHLGHAATFVWADVLASILDSTGIEVRMCRNITDVDDVLTEAARRRGRHYDQLAAVQEAAYERSMKSLRVAPPAAEPKARHHIAAVQQLAENLLQVGAAYERDGTVWFRGAKVPAAAGLNREQACDLARYDGDDPDDSTGDDPLDVAVWRPSSTDQPAWPSPWGWGRPGWHAECAAMALTVHGSSVDVVVGGDDLVFPHHAYQAAMAEAVTGVAPFSRTSLHVGQVRLNGEKMAKSTGNLVLVDDILTSHTPGALRTLLIDRRWHEPWDFDPAALHGAQSRLERLLSAAGRPGTDPAAAEALASRLRDDLDVPAALDIAEAAGGEAARLAIRLLRLG